MRVAIDVGGTFTDVVRLDGDRVVHDKVPTTPGDVTRGIMAGLDRLGPEAAAGIELLVHGTTVALNALLEGATPPVGLVTTAGFRDVLEIGRTSRPVMYDLQQVPAAPLVPRRRRYEIGARMAADGAELAPVDAAEVAALAARMLREGVSAIAVCLLNAYADPRHEHAVAAILAEAAPGVPVTCSVDLSREWREFERTSTAVVNAATLPVLGGYLDRLEDGLQDAGFGGRLMIMQSSGGVMSVADARSRPVSTLMSGPVGGVVGAQAISVALGGADLITVDIGGTSADVAVIDGGQAVHAEVGRLGPWPLLVPMVDIRSIGAGGGSIARIDDHGALLVGPDSAGAVPGPACYGRGGTRATVTDANVVLGRITPERFMEGEMPLDLAAAREAVLRDVAEPLGIGLERAAEGVVTVMNSITSRLLREVLTERGHDPRRFSLLAFGGGGGLHACAMAQEAGLARAIVPPNPGTMSAFGILGADIRHDGRAMMLTEASRLTDAALAAAFEEVLDRLGASTGLGGAGMVCTLAADVRYLGQSSTVPVPVPDLRDGALERLVAGFHAEHLRLYGVCREEHPVEVIRIRVAMLEPTVRLAPGAGAAPATRPAVAREGGVHERSDLVTADVLMGPALIEEPGATTWVADGWRAEIDPHRNIVLERVAA